MEPTATPTFNALPAEVGAARARAGQVSLVAGAAIFLAKLGAWMLTGSNAVLSDALESTVNVVAAFFAVRALRFAAQPADEDHPYGHGKAEQLAAAFEGGLITFAALLILYEAGVGIVHGTELRALDTGLVVLAAAGAANLLLGLWLVRAGRRLESPTLLADGQHVLSDVWTSGGVLVGLTLVRLTGWALLDPLVAAAMGLWLARTGVKLVRGAAHALLDAEDPRLLQRLVDAYNEASVAGLTGLHHLRALRHGDAVHVDAHVFVPCHWRVREAHEAAHALEREMTKRARLVGELALHLDPCDPGQCPDCPLEPCEARGVQFAQRKPLTLREAIGGPPNRC